MAKVKVQLYKPHPGQVPIHKSKARFRVATCGRRFGKTYLAINEIVRRCLERPGTMNWWVAPTYDQSAIAFRIICENFEGAMASKRESPKMEIKWLNGSILQFKSTNKADSLRGEGVHFLVVDEAQDVKDEDWQASLRPTISDKPGDALIIGTPKKVGHWFHTMFTRGRDPEWPDYESFNLRTADNPIIPPEEIEEARRSLPDRIFRQEYLAEFVDGESAVFRGIMACRKGDFEEPLPGKRYRIGWDVAKHTDYSVITVMREDTRHVVAFDRFNQVDWEVQINRLEKLYRKYNRPPILMDSTGVGDPVYDMVRKRGMKVEGYKFNNTSKEHLINKLSAAIENQEISFPDIQVLIDELVIYEYEITQSGNIRFNAPEGKHDDCVISLALATWHTLNKRPLQLF